MVETVVEEAVVPEVEEMAGRGTVAAEAGRGTVAAEAGRGAVAAETEEVARTGVVVASPNVCNPLCPLDLLPRVCRKTPKCTHCRPPLYTVTHRLNY